MILLHSKSLKKCHKKFENLLTDKKFTTKNDLDSVFCMYKGSNPKFYQIGILFKCSELNQATVFGVGSQHIK